MERKPEEELGKVVGVVKGSQEVKLHPLIRANQQPGQFWDLI